ncbi:hypothetical protein D3C81_2255900 [compost metagenome]
MSEMYPKCTKMMANKMPKEKRATLIPKIVKSLVDNGSAGMGKEEKDLMVKTIIDSLKS